MEENERTNQLFQEMWEEFDAVIQSDEQEV